MGQTGLLSRARVRRADRAVLPIKPFTPGQPMRFPSVMETGRSFGGPHFRRISHVRAEVLLDAPLPNNRGGNRSASERSGARYSIDRRGMSDCRDDNTWRIG